jgi:hypothetical protein
MVGYIDDDAVALRLDPELVIMKMHLASVELIPLWNVWGPEGVTVVAAGDCH